MVFMWEKRTLVCFDKESIVGGEGARRYCAVNRKGEVCDGIPITKNLEFERILSIIKLEDDSILTFFTFYFYFVLTLPVLYTAYPKPG